MTRSADYYKIKLKAVAYYSGCKLSLVCLLLAIVLACRGTHGINFLQWWLTAIGLLLLAIFIAVCRSIGPDMDRSVIVLHLSGMLTAILALLCLIIFAFININNMNISDNTYGPDYNFYNYDMLRRPTPVKEYNLTDYGGLLRQHMMADRQYWATISARLRNEHACDGMSPLVRDPQTGAYLAERPSKTSPYDVGLSPIESGCCKPPLSCEFTYVNQTTWTPTVSGALAMVTTNVDCGRWSNDQQTLCFQCDSCKAAVLADIGRVWSFPPLFWMAFVVVVHVIFYPVQVWLFLISQEE